jgi:hypothetical protein
VLYYLSQAPFVLVILRIFQGWPGPWSSYLHFLHGWDDRYHHSAIDWSFCWGWDATVILQLSASRVTRIISVIPCIQVEWNIKNQRCNSYVQRSKIKLLMRQVLVAHSCNPSYSGGRDQEDCSSKPAQGNSSWDPISKNLLTKNWAGGVAQSESPEFNPQYWKKEIKNKTTTKLLMSQSSGCLTNAVFWWWGGWNLKHCSWKLVESAYWQKHNPELEDLSSGEDWEDIERRQSGLWQWRWRLSEKAAWVPLQE